MTGTVPDATLTIRKFHFSAPPNLPRFWYQGCCVRTHLFNAIAILTPAFERLAISSVQPFLARLDPVCQKDITDFIAQESAHSRAFLQYNQYLREIGYDTKRLALMNIQSFQYLSKHGSPTMHLALTLAAEHITAIFSAFLLSKEHSFENVHDSIRTLWQWHALEELEHHAVIYDLYQKYEGGYARRVLAMVLLSMMLGTLLFKNYCHLARQDNRFFSLSFWMNTMRIVFIFPGSIRRMLPAYLRYFKPGYTPAHFDKNALGIWQQIFSSFQFKKTRKSVL